MATRGGDYRQRLGRQAEDAAAAALVEAGFSIVGRNVRFREGEIDLVCRDRDVWVFVEVKCRHERWGDAPAAAVSPLKQRRLVRLAQHYLKRWRLGEPRCRFDVVGVTVNDRGVTMVRHLVNAFQA
jgi:putative endonuclease